MADIWAENWMKTRSQPSKCKERGRGDSRGEGLKAGTFTAGLKKNKKRQCDRRSLHQQEKSRSWSWRTGWGWGLHCIGPYWCALSLLGKSGWEYFLKYLCSPSSSTQAPSVQWKKGNFFICRPQSLWSWKGELLQPKARARLTAEQDQGHWGLEISDNH